MLLMKPQQLVLLLLLQQIQVLKSLLHTLLQARHLLDHFVLQFDKAFPNFSVRCSLRSLGFFQRLELLVGLGEVYGLCWTDGLFLSFLALRRLFLFVTHQLLELLGRLLMLLLEVSECLEQTLEFPLLDKLIGSISLIIRVLLLFST